MLLSILQKSLTTTRIITKIENNIVIIIIIESWNHVEYILYFVKVLHLISGPTGKMAEGKNMTPAVYEP